MRISNALCQLTCAAVALIRAYELPLGLRQPGCETASHDARWKKCAAYMSYWLGRHGVRLSNWRLRLQTDTNKSSAQGPRRGPSRTDALRPGGSERGYDNHAPGRRRPGRVLGAGGVGGRGTGP